MKKPPNISIPLREFCKNHPQRKVAEVMGVTNGAVWQMFRDEREVYIECTPLGEPVGWFEIKRPRKEGAA